MAPFNLSTSNLTMKNAMFKYGESFAFPKRRSELYTIKWINQKKLLQSKLQSNAPGILGKNSEY